MRSTYLFFCIFFSYAMTNTPSFWEVPPKFHFFVTAHFVCTHLQIQYIPTTPASLSTNHATAGQLCPVAMETWLLIFRTSLTLIRDRPRTIEKSMGLSSSKRTAVQQGRKKREIESELKSFVVFFFCVCDRTGSLARSRLNHSPSRIL